jgi:hypothetical protein
MKISYKLTAYTLNTSQKSLCLMSAGYHDRRRFRRSNSESRDPWVLRDDLHSVFHDQEVYDDPAGDH